MLEDTRNDGRQENSVEALQLEKLRLDNEKLRLELGALKKGKGLKQVMPFTPLITVLVTLAAFGFGIYQYRAEQDANRVATVVQSAKEREEREIQSKKDTDAAQREFMKPLLQNQLSLYLQVSSAAATIVRSTDSAERQKALNDFWRLYEGPLIMVESKDVSSAMVAFGNCLDQHEDCDPGELSKRSRALASRL